MFAAASLVMATMAHNRILSVAIAALLAALVGILLCAIAWFRLEWIARLLTKPVAAGRPIASPSAANRKLVLKTPNSGIAHVHRKGVCNPH